MPKFGQWLAVHGPHFLPLTTYFFHWSIKRVAVSHFSGLYFADMQRFEVHGECQVVVETPRLVRVDRPAVVMTDAVHGVTVHPCGDKQTHFIDYEVDVPMCLHTIHASWKARLSVSDAAALTPSTLKLAITHGASVSLAPPMWLHRLEVALRDTGKLTASGMVVGELSVCGDGDSRVDVGGMCVRELVHVERVKASRSVHIECTQWTTIDAPPGVVTATSLTQRVLPRIPTTLYDGPCQFCQEERGTLAGTCGHLFVCQRCMEESGAQRIYNAPCPLCRSTVHTLVSWAPLRCLS